MEQIEEAIAAGAHMLLLDNFSPSRCATRCEQIAGRVPVEVSGGVRLENVRDYAEAGPDYIAVGALTHSAAAVDISLEIEIRERRTAGVAGRRRSRARPAPGSRARPRPAPIEYFDRVSSTNDVARERARGGSGAVHGGPGRRPVGGPRPAGPGVDLAAGEPLPVRPPAPGGPLRRRGPHPAGRGRGGQRGAGRLRRPRPAEVAERPRGRGEEDRRAPGRGLFGRGGRRERRAGRRGEPLARSRRGPRRAARRDHVRQGRVGPRGVAGRGRGRDPGARGRLVSCARPRGRGRRAGGVARAVGALVGPAGRGARPASAWSAAWPAAWTSAARCSWTSRTAPARRCCRERPGSCGWPGIEQPACRCFSPSTSATPTPSSASTRGRRSAPTGASPRAASRPRTSTGSWCATCSRPRA